jgi:hypothetical protein
MTRKDMTNLTDMFHEALAIEAEEAREAGAVGYMARALVQATMPHSKPSGHVFQRTNGNYTLTMMASPSVGLPYGTIPRLLLAWLATEAVKKQSPYLTLGESLSDFMRELDLVPTGGRWGSITRLKEQSRRLFACTIQCQYEEESGEAIRNYLIADEANLWWYPKTPDQQSLFESTVKLSDTFFRELLDAPVPIDIRALKVLRRSPLALDIYCWLTYRMSYLKKPTRIPWDGLQAQFGADYAFGSQGRRDFKKRFIQAAKKVLTVYPDAKLEATQDYLMLSPSKTHIKHTKKIAR